MSDEPTRPSNPYAPHDPAAIFEDMEALTKLVQDAMTAAARAAVAENDALGIPTAYSVNGKIMFRQPAKRSRPEEPEPR